MLRANLKSRINHVNFIFLFHILKIYLHINQGIAAQVHNSHLSILEIRYQFLVFYPIEN